jgi:hypothetical protein
MLFDIVEQRKRNAGGACPGGFAVKLLVLIKGGLWSGTQWNANALRLEKPSFDRPSNWP